MSAVTMTPREIVAELNQHIIGQDEAKRAVAIALRNRWRRSQIADPEMRDEILPKNILMIGPTGVGKTEISRRLARLVEAPFIKVEATKFTEVGYVGRDVESIIRDLADSALKQAREAEMAKVEHLAEEAAEERILDALLPPARDSFSEEQTTADKDSSARQSFREKVRRGELDDTTIEVELSASPVGVEIMAPPGMEEMTSQLQGLFQNMGRDNKQTRKLTIKNAKRVLLEEEAASMINEDDLKAKTVENVEQNGIVFLDEIDKVTRRSDQNSGGGDVSREGVQRDLLPLVEGCTVFTKYGMIKTDHILFIASGAFHVAKPSDLIAELQGRLPIRVEMKALTADDFVRILTEPSNSLTEQYTALMATESVELKFNKKGVRRIAEAAWHVNERTENIGARRLYTVMERLLETISFEATDRDGDKIMVDDKYVDKYLAMLIEDEDLTRYIL